MCRRFTSSWGRSSLLLSKRDSFSHHITSHAQQKPMESFDIYVDESQSFIISNIIFMWFFKVLSNALTHQLEESSTMMMKKQKLETKNFFFFTLQLYLQIGCSFSSNTSLPERRISLWTLSKELLLSSVIITTSGHCPRRI